MEEFGEPLEFPLCCTDWGAGAIREESAWGEGMGTGAPVSALLAEPQCLGLKHPCTRGRGMHKKNVCSLWRGVSLC